MARLWRVMREVFWILVAVAIVAGGVLGFRLLGAARQVVEPAAVERTVAAVETVVMVPFDDGIPIRGEGFVRSFRSLGVAAQAGGRIVALHPAIESHGAFAQGDVLVRLDDRAARANIEQTEANIGSTQARLELTETQLDRARRLNQRGVVARDQVDELAARQAELAASVAGLRAALTAAQIALDNTVVKAPFDGKVLEKQADVGAVVSTGQAVALIYAHEALEVTLPLRETEAALVPGLFAGERAAAKVVVRFAGIDHMWEAAVDRVENRLDPQTRTLAVAVRIRNPAVARVAGTAARPVAGEVPPLINAFAKVTIEGARYAHLYAIETTALRAGATIWLAAEDRLAVHPVEIVHTDGPVSYVRVPDLPEAAQLVTSRLAAPADGMPVRVVDQPSPIAATPESG